MNIFFRVDNSSFIGTGHIIRCLKLAKYFENCNIFFICKKFSNNLNKKVLESGYKLFEIEIKTDLSNLDTDSWLGESFENDCTNTINILKKYEVDLLIIDQYAIDHQWQKKLKNMLKKY